MARALELARRGEALASPNPMVGSVVVRSGRVVGEGFHTYDGRRHAEIVALERARGRACGATLYVNLEPCCHRGRTGPCTEAILAAGVTRVVAAMADPNPRVAGRGFRRLRRGGVRVETGLCRRQARQLNEAFAKWIRTGTPLVTLKAALSLDGKIAARKRRERWITSPESRAEVQRLRQGADAVVTGIGTVLEDNPRLTDRSGRPRRRRMLRVVLDSRLRLPLDSRLVRSAAGDVLVITGAAAGGDRARALREAGVEVVGVRGRRGRPELGAVLKELGRREILSVLLECGATLNRAALEAGIVDKIVLYCAPKVVGPDGVPMVRGGAGILRRLRLRGLTLRRVGPDFSLEGYLRDVYRDR